MIQMNGLLSGKNIVIMGVANERSLAWGIAKSLHASGANLIFTYRKERSFLNLTQLLLDHAITPLLCVACDVSSDISIQETFKEIGLNVDVIHGLAHSIAFAERGELQGEYLETTREGFHLAQDISAYSLVAVAKACKSLMSEGGSIVAQSYLGAERVIKNYNVMGVAKAALEASVRYLAEDLGKHGIRVNAISAGPVRTLAAKGVSDFNEILRENQLKAPLRKSVTQDEVGDATLFLLSHLSRGITGEVIHVDSGYHVI